MVLVSGATGLLGSFICKALLLKGFQVKAFCRPQSNFALVKDIKNQITWVNADVLDVDSIEDAMAGVSQVVHCAALVGIGKRNTNAMYKVNVEGTANMVNIALKKNINKFIHISSISALGKSNSIGTIDENSKTEFNDIGSHYGKSKYLAELEVWRAENEGLATIVINPSVVLGPGDWEKDSSRIFKYVWDKKPFYTEGNLNYVDVRDVAEIITLLLPMPVRGDQFVINSGTTTYNDFFSKVAIGFSVNPPRIKLTPKLAHMSSFIMNFGRLFGLSNPFSKDIVNASFSSRVYCADKIKEKLDFQFQGLEKSSEWNSAELIKKYNLNVNR